MKRNIPAAIHELKILPESALPFFHTDTSFTVPVISIIADIEYSK
ncbi:hypothetical protein HNQ91_002303 [Filimonas zeae]|nr:hypothetical protein [Filimonas zeae]MDR6339252.1 hypothetical protein [Filimonas zeae]